jgi:hypothetical protein
MRVVFPDGSLGQMVKMPPTWQELGYLRNRAVAGDAVDMDGQSLQGICWAITDMLDANGNPLTNDAEIMGFTMHRSGTDPVGFFAVIPLSPEPGGVTILVDPNGDIAAANATAQAGDTIDIAAGTYVLASQIEIKDGVTYKGAGPGLTIIDGNNVTRAFAAWGNRGATNGQVDANGVGIPNLTGPTGWVIEGLTIQNCVSDPNDRQDILSAARDLLNNYVAGTPYTLATAQTENGGIMSNPGWFDILSGSADDNLTDVELQAYLAANPPGSAGHLVVNDGMDKDGAAIDMRNGAKGTIRNCTISNCTSTEDGGAIYAALSKFNAVAGEPGISVEGVTIDGCTGLDDGGGIFIDSDAANDEVDIQAPNVLIDNTVVSNCRAGGPAPDNGDRDGGGMYLDDRMGSVTITNTIVDTCTSGRHCAGIHVEDKSDVCLIDSCKILNCSNDAIDGESGDGVAIGFARDQNVDVTVTNCIFANNVNNQDDAVVKIDTRLLTVANCTFVGNISRKDKGILRFGTSEENASIVNMAINNLFVNNDTSGGSDEIIDWDKNGNKNITHNNAFFGNILDTGDKLIKNTDANAMLLSGDFIITVDPLVNTAGGDYHLAVGSAAINAGTANGAPDHDIEGNARPQGAAHDVGAYEFAGP